MDEVSDGGGEEKRQNKVVDGSRICTGVYLREKNHQRSKFAFFTQLSS